MGNTPFSSICFHILDKNKSLPIAHATSARTSKTIVRINTLSSITNSKSPTHSPMGSAALCAAELALVNSRPDLHNAAHANTRPNKTSLSSCPFIEEDTTYSFLICCRTVFQEICDSGHFARTSVKAVANPCRAQSLEDVRPLIKRLSTYSTSLASF